MSNALDDLIAAVEAGTVDGKFSPLYERAIYPITQNMDEVYLTSDAYNGSLDAALALHNAVLPTWDWRAEENVNGYVSHIGPAREEFMPSTMAVSLESAARAWLLAILRAMKEGKDA
ncbi:hypothetical protein [Sulfitobacter sp. 1A12157]|uniref:hypothetical protein n=1 Tax=Sulfitobacter sp. 1A12157 TaxID=3368594 RepID=UPI0037468461